MGLKELQDVKPRPKEKQDFKLCAFKLMNSYAVWNTMQEIKTLGFFQLVILGDFSFFFFLAQFSSQTSTKGRPEHSDNFRGSFYFFFFSKKKMLSLKKIVDLRLCKAGKQQHCALQ